MDRLEALRFFVEVAEAGSFSSVARARAVAVSTVTLALQRLEAELGVALIVRTTRQLSLSHDGERFIGSARRLLADWDKGVDALHQNGPLKGPIFMTAPNDFGRSRVLDLIDEFMILHPDVDIHLMLSDGLVDLVEQHIDLALRTGPLQDSALRARLLLRGPRLICASPGYWLANGKPQHPTDLRQHNCLVLAKPGAAQTTWQFVEKGRSLLVKVKGDRTANDGGALREWAIRGRGVVLKVKWDILSDLQTKRLEPALENYIAEQINLYAVYPGDPPNRRVTVLIDFLVSRLADEST